MPVKPVPDGYATISPMVVADNADELLSWVQTAFDTRELVRINKQDGSLMAADLAIGTASISIVAPSAEMNMPAYKAVFYLYVPDADAAYARAVEAGGKSLQEPKDEQHGDRMGGIADPAGNQWWIASRIENLTNEELQKRMQGMGQGSGA